MLALLALALSPVAAHAEESSNEAIYKVAPPEISKPTTSSTEEKSGKSPSSHHKAETNPPAKASGAEGNGGTENSGEAEKSAEEPESEGHKKSKEEGSGSGKNGNPPTSGGGGGNTPQGGGGGGGAGDGISNGKAVPQQQSGANVSHSTGGSSPVVPILIAVIVLAAISIGVVLYRQRKSGQGPDSRVSSPNAS
jgi:cobalamin biosynthesis Mg chelatase CobN